MSTLYVVATPIGNLEDITLRAIRILSEVSVILAEDTRHFGKLVAHLTATQTNYSITASVQRLDEHTEPHSITRIVSLLDEGKDIALVSDAGTPLISDPGFLLVKAITTQTAHTVIAIPGTSAVTAALSVAGLPPYPAMFLGFLPPKQAKLIALLKSVYTVHHGIATTFVAYESPHRITETIHALNTFCKEAQTKLTLVVLNELTKIHEKSIRLVLPLQTEMPEIKGEITLVWRFS